ncbi:GntR family transcriptional regulator [Labrys monachus]|uniref:DNA-binding GntR family transcriptional regulator n=1 Tax=Labrys monachus TaxID=217067 RepID=A0ABU0FGY6_9HYPH|nr:GntR family transcriptional regulator [Labrys monachus]MDQ0393881.1 DNA-binding GntR family transcriptional regulator [Labrys monachus]
MTMASYAADLQEEKDRSLSRLAYDSVLDMLIRHELPLNTVLHERRLAERLNISRTPVREALNRLESEGFVSRMPGRVLVVKNLSTRELIETLHVRGLLEAEAAALAAGRVPAAELDRLEADIRALLATLEPKPEDDWEVDSRVHGTITRHGGNALLARLVEGFRVKTHMFNLKRVPERFAIGHREHLAIIDALRRADGQAARKGIETHIENVKQSVIQALSQI